MGTLGSTSTQLEKKRHQMPLHHNQRCAHTQGSKLLFPPSIIYVSHTRSANTRPDASKVLTEAVDWGWRKPWQLPCNCATHRRNEGLPTSSLASVAKKVRSRCTGTRSCFSISVGARVGSGGEHETRGDLIRCSSTYTTRSDSFLLTLHSNGRTSYEAAAT
jgi:hypothetical protein